MEPITEAFEASGYNVQASPNFLAVYAKGRTLVATIAPVGTPDQPPIGESASGQHYLGTRHSVEAGSQVKYRTGDNVDAFVRKVLRLPPMEPPS